MNRLKKGSIINGQSAAKPLLNEEGSETISRKESRLGNYLSEKPDIIIENLFSIRKFSKVCCIYCIYSKTRMIPYIGSTINLQRRIQKHREALRKKSHFSKYLQNIFNIESEKDIFIFIIELCNIQDIQEKECYWIKYFDAVKNGLNASYDTQRNFVNESIKQIIKQKNSKPVLMFTKEGELIKEFPSVKSAAIFVNDQSTNISACCSQKLRWVKQFVFRYKNGFKEFNLRQSNRGTYNKKHLSLCKKLTSKKVICNNIIYDSVSEAERQYNISRGTLGYYIKNNKQYKDLLFNYYEDIVQS